MKTGESRFFVQVYTRSLVYSTKAQTHTHTCTTGSKKQKIRQGKQKSTYSRRGVLTPVFHPHLEPKQYWRSPHTSLYNTRQLWCTNDATGTTTETTCTHNSIAAPRTRQDNNYYTKRVFYRVAPPPSCALPHLYYPKINQVIARAKHAYASYHYHPL